MSPTIVAGAAGSQVSVLATPVNSFSGNVAVTIAGLPAGVTANPATLTLSPGAAQSENLAEIPIEFTSTGRAGFGEFDFHF